MNITPWSINDVSVRHIDFLQLPLCYLPLPGRSCFSICLFALCAIIFSNIGFLAPLDFNVQKKFNRCDSSFLFNLHQHWLKSLHQASQGHPYETNFFNSIYPTLLNCQSSYHTGSEIIPKHSFDHQVWWADVGLYFRGSTSKFAACHRLGVLQEAHVD